MNAMETALKTAAAALTENDKLQAAIAAAERDLQAAIVARLQADGALAAAEAATALNGGTVEPARQKHADAVAGLTTAEARLLGLQQKQRQHRPVLESASDDITTARRKVAEDMVGDFTTEWARGCEGMGKLLARRMALESILGPLSLPAPAATANHDDTGALAEPGRVLAQLRGSATSIPTEADMAELEGKMRVRLSRARGGVGAFDPSGLYRFAQAQNLGGHLYQAGDFISGRLIGPATGAWMLNCKILHPATATSLECVG